MTFTVTDLMISALPTDGWEGAAGRADTADISTCEDVTAGQCDVPARAPEDSTCENVTAGGCEAPPLAPEDSTCEDVTAGRCGDRPQQRAIGDEERELLLRHLEAALAAER